jgi:5-methylcytosine-specific restriction enzyme subunit McrC
MIYPTDASSGLFQRVLEVREFEDVVLEPTVDLGSLYGLDWSTDDTELSERLFGVRVSRGKVVLQARSFVGLIPLDRSTMLQVKPRVPVSNWRRILEVGRRLPYALSMPPPDYQQDGPISELLLDGLVDALRRGVSEIRDKGLLKEYVRKEERTSNPRGRLVVGATLVDAATGNHLRVASTWFHRTPDIPANQCLRYAVHVLSALNERLARSGYAAAARRNGVALNQCAHDLQGVSLVDPRRFLTDPFVSGASALPALRSYYEQPLRVARAIARDQGVDITAPGSALTLQPLVVNMADAFEHYLREVLRSEADLGDRRVRVMDGNLPPPDGARHALLDNNRFMAKPDIVIRSERQSDVIIEVKYVPGDLRSQPRIDAIHQSLAYGVSTGARNVVIAQPAQAGAAVGLGPLGSVRGITLWHYVIDLGSPQLPSEEERFVDEMFRLHANQGDRVPGPGLGGS